MSKKCFIPIISNNFMRGVIIIIIMFLKIYKKLFFRKTGKSPTRSKHILKICFYVFLSRRQAVIKSASTIFYTSV